MGDADRLEVDRVVTRCPSKECPYRTVDAVRGAGLDVLVVLRAREGADPLVDGLRLSGTAEARWTVEAHVRSPRGQGLLDLKVGDQLSREEVDALVALAADEDTEITQEGG